MHYLSQLSLRHRDYARINRAIHWLAAMLSKDWDRRLLGVNALPIGSILDIGANEGQFAKRMRSRFPKAQIYAFEPLPDAAQRLRQWANTQRGAVQVFEVALGDCTQTVFLQQHLYFSASSSLLATTAHGEALYPFMGRQQRIPVQQMTLDDVIAQLPQPLRPDVLIKLDVQGYEDRVLRGASQTLRAAKACIVEISLDGLYEGQASFQSVFDSLRQAGYTYGGNLDQIQAKDGHVIYLNALFLNPAPTLTHGSRSS